MFSEVLKIKPVLDTATTKQMEQNLSSRFGRVAQRFGQGLKAVIKGSFIGISLGLISKLLNPIEALEDKIKKLLGEGTDIRELADRFNTDPGKLKQIQDVAQTMGVTPDQFKDMLTKYAEAIEKGREEVANPFQERSASTIALKQFLGEKDIGKSFTDFLTSLKSAGQGPGTDVALTENARSKMAEAARQGRTLSDDERKELLSKGELRQRTGLETRAEFEKEIFGQQQFGAAKRFINTDLGKATKGMPDAATLTARINKAASLDDRKRALDVKNGTEDFVNATNKLNGKMIQDMAASDRLEMDRDTKQLESYEDLRKAANGLEEIKGLLINVSNLATKGLGYLGEVSTFIQGMKQNRWFRNVFGGGKD